MAYAPSSILATEHPVHLAVLTFSCSALCLLVIARQSQPARDTGSDERGDYASIALAELRNGEAKVAKEKQRKQTYSLNSAVLFVIILVASAALTVRIDIQRRLLLVSECTTRSVEVWLPFVVAIYDALRFQERGLPDNDENEDEDLDASAYYDFARSFRSSILSSPWRYVPAAFLLSLGCHMVAGLWSNSASSHVCPISSSDIVVVPRLQWLALLLDSLLAIASLELVVGGPTTSMRVLSAPTSWAIVLTTAAGLWCVVAMVVHSTQPENHAWLLLEHEPSRVGALLSLICQALFLATFGISLLYTASRPISSFYPWLIIC